VYREYFYNAFNVTQRNRTHLMLRVYNGI